MLNLKYKQKYLKYKQKYIQALTKQKGGDTKNILVLCQRKTGRSATNDYDVEEVVVPKITELIQTLLGFDTSIVYMTKLEKKNPGTVDIDCYLGDESECSKKFIEKHNNFFDLIILQTCPFIFFNFDIVINLLKPKGMLALTSFPAPFDKKNFLSFPYDGIITKLTSKNLIEHEQAIDGILFIKNT